MLFFAILCPLHLNDARCRTLAGASSLTISIIQKVEQSLSLLRSSAPIQANCAQASGRRSMDRALGWAAERTTSSMAYWGNFVIFSIIGTHTHSLSLSGPLLVTKLLLRVNLFACRWLAARRVHEVPKRGCAEHHDMKGGQAKDCHQTRNAHSWCSTVLVAERAPFFFLCVSWRQISLCTLHSAVL